MNETTSRAFADEGTGSLPDRRGELIKEILQHQDFDSLLRLGVVLANYELDGDGCSLFLFEPERNTIILKESTVLTRFLGVQGAVIDRATEDARVQEIQRLLAELCKKPADLSSTLTWEEAEPLGQEVCAQLFQYGLTQWTFWTGCPLVIDDVREDFRWSSYNKVTTFSPRRKSGLSHCELSTAEIGSILVVNIPGEGNLPRAVMRILRKRDKVAFSRADLNWLLEFSSLLGRSSKAAVKLSELTDLGAQLQVEDFGRKLVDLFHKVLQADGCSIFLELDRTGEGKRRVFQCIATTGLVEMGEPVDTKANYVLEAGQQETKHLTEWVLLRGQLAAIADVHTFDSRDYPNLDRPPGSGKFSETDAEGNKFEVGPLLISPLFLYQGGEVAGAIRISRRRGEVFETHEQLVFLAISKLLSRVLTTLHLRQVSEKLIKLYGEPDAMLDLIPREVCRLLGVEGASILLMRNEKLTLEATVGLLEGKEGTIQYDVNDPLNRGRTGWVAFYRRPLLLNRPEDEDLYGPDPPRHSPSEEGHPCESGQKAYRFLAVPILHDPDDPRSQVHGVVRVPRVEKDPPFDAEIHLSILTSFAARLSLALNLARRSAQLRESLVRVGTEMTSERTLPEKLGVIADAAARVTRADNVIIHEYVGPPPEPGGRRGRFRESARGGQFSPMIWRAIEVGRDAVPFRVVEHGEPIFAIVAEQSEVLFYKKDEPNFIQREKIRSVAALPLKVGRDTCVGCVFFNFASPQEFKVRQRQEIQLMAEYAAVAIYQARLLDETRKLAQEKSNLLRYAEHSLNQPLNALQCFLDNLADGTYYDELKPALAASRDQYPQSGFAQSAQQQYELCEYLGYLVKMFLQIDRLETEARNLAGAEMVYRDFFRINPARDSNLSALCRRAAGVAEAYLHKTEHQQMDRHIQEGVTGFFDKTAIQISLLNVLVNAVKYGRPEDPRKHREIRLTLNTEQEGRMEIAVIHVEDSGEGIPEEERERVFDKGYRIAQGPRGLGIGLFLTRGFFEAHGGSVQVQKSRFGGADFVLRLPLAR